MPKKVSYVANLPYASEKEMGAKFKLTPYYNASEHEHQVCFFELVRGVKLECLKHKSGVHGRFAMCTDEQIDFIIDACEQIYAIPNGGARDSDKNIAKLVGAQLKMEGVKKGVPDITLDLPMCGYHGLKMELKKFGGKITDEQFDFMMRSRRYNFICVCGVGYITLFKVFICYLNLNSFYPELNYDEINFYHDLKQQLIS